VTTTADVLIVGGGPAGLAAAIELRRLGVRRVIVLEREREAGGVPRHSAHTGFGLRDLRRLLSGPRYAARYVRLASNAGVELRTEATATDWTAETTLSVTSPAGIEEIRARAVLLATGCRERPRAARLVPGTRPLGVLTTGALQQLVYVQHAAVGRRAVVIGTEHVSFSALLTLAHAGVAPIAMITEHPRHQTYAPFKWLSATHLRVPILTSSRVTEIVGARRVEAVAVANLVTGAVTHLACDTVVFTGDWIADHELARHANLVIDRGTRAPRVDLALRTSTHGVFAAGNLLHGAETADVAALSGRHAARAMHAFLATGSWPSRAPLAVRCEPPIRWVSPNAVDDRSAPPHGHFILRVSECRERPTLVVAQGERDLWRKLYRELLPNLPIWIPGSWLDDVQLDGPELVFRLDRS